VRILLIILGLAVAAGGGIWHARTRSLAACREGVSLRKAAVKPLPWLEAASRDRFLVALLQQGEAADAIRGLRLRAAIAAGEPWSWHLPDSFKAGMKSLVIAAPTDKNFLEALRSFSALPIPEACAEAEDSRLMEAFAAGEIYWHSRLNEARMAKLSFAHDREIFCQSEALTARLKAVLGATEARCAKSKKGCQASATAPIQQEIEDIEMQKEFNRQKLRRKWPEEILEELKCS
jgi:hypothetical protein